MSPRATWQSILSLRSVLLLLAGALASSPSEARDTDPSVYLGFDFAEIPFDGIDEVESGFGFSAEVDHWIRPSFAVGLGLSHHWLDEETRFIPVTLSFFLPLRSRSARLLPFVTFSPGFAIETFPSDGVGDWGWTQTGSDRGMDMGALLAYGAGIVLSLSKSYSIRLEDRVHFSYTSDEDWRTVDALQISLGVRR